MNKITSTNQIQVLQFVVQNAHICLDLSYVNKVLPLLMLDIVPNSPLFFAGLMNLEGKIIPVIDLALRLGMHRNKKYSLDMSILLCTYDLHQAGLIVDDVTGLSTINEETIQMHEEFDKTSSPFIGSISINSNLSLLLNLDYIFPIDINNDDKIIPEPSLINKNASDSEIST
jgi:purine-binding chemotaxis protein CheW